MPIAKAEPVASFIALPWDLVMRAKALGTFGRRLCQRTIDPIQRAKYPRWGYPDQCGGHE